MASNTDISQAMPSPASDNQNSIDQQLTSETDQNAGGVTRSCSTFTCFSKFPMELRLKIWNYASFQTRNIDVWVGLVSFAELSDNAHVEHTPHYFYSTVGNPAILHTCRESRAEGLKFYKLSLGADLICQWPRLPPFNIWSPPRIYINWEADRLCIMEPENHDFRSAYADLCRQAEKNHLVYIAFNTKPRTPDFSTIHEFLGFYFYSIWDLEEIVLFESNDRPTTVTATLDFKDIDEPSSASSRMLEARNYLDHEIEVSKNECREDILSEGRTAAEVDAEMKATLWWKVRLCEVAYNTN